MSEEKYCITVPPPGFERSTLYRPAVDISFYLHHTSATLSTDETVVTVASDVLSADPSALLRFLKYQTQLPPRPQICIKGSHTSDGKSQVDFDIRLDLQGYIMTRPVYPPPVEASQLSASEAGTNLVNDGGQQITNEHPPNQVDESPSSSQAQANNEDGNEMKEPEVPGKGEDGTDMDLSTAMKNVTEMFCHSDREKKA
jgi:hypothetical protein